MTREQIKKVLQKKCVDMFKGEAPWDIEEIAAAVERLSARYKVEPVLALAQGILESHWVCNPAAWRSRKTKNIFNVGNTDAGMNMYFPDYVAGIDRYFRLMAREYCWRKEGDTVTVDMMVKHDFTRPRGGRYATAPNYTRDIESIARSIRALIDMGPDITEMAAKKAPKPKPVEAAEPPKQPAKADKTAVKKSGSGKTKKTAAGQTEKTGSRVKPGMTGEAK